MTRSFGGVIKAFHILNTQHDFDTEAETFTICGVKGMIRSECGSSVDRNNSLPVREHCIFSAWFAKRLEIQCSLVEFYRCSDIGNKQLHS